MPRISYVFKNSELEVFSPDLIVYDSEKYSKVITDNLKGDEDV